MLLNEKVFVLLVISVVLVSFHHKVVSCVVDDHGFYLAHGLWLRLTDALLLRLAQNFCMLFGINRDCLRKILILPVLFIAALFFLFALLHKKNDRYDCQYDYQRHQNC